MTRADRLYFLGVLLIIAVVSFVSICATAGAIVLLVKVVT